jgi:hypothetical protein
MVATGQELTRPLGLVLLAEAMGQVGQVTARLRLLVEARTVLEAGGRGDLLAPIYGWFTEGFDTADLQEAKALLAELAR